MRSSKTIHVVSCHADAGFIIMEPEDTPPMSGSNSICVATVLLDSGIIAITEPVTKMVLEAPRLSGAGPGRWQGR